jgi:hypothetical protein
MVRAVDGGWLTARELPGGSTEIVGIDATGRVERLTESASDDLDPDPSPDGERLSFITTRWDTTLHHLDVAVLDRRTRAVTPITRTPDWELSPRWSPDGTRIAFVRKSTGAVPNAVCVIGIDGQGERCLAGSASQPEYLLAWLGDDAVVATIDTAGSPALAVLSLETGAVRVLHRGAVDYVVSPDARWFAARVLAEASTRLRLVVGEVRQPELLREVTLPAPPDGMPSWDVVRPSGRALDRLVIEGGDAREPVDAERRLSVRGVDASGRPVVPRAVRWWSGDTAVATVDDSGRVEPRRPGRVRIEASAGGWRRAAVELTVAPSRQLVILEESWRGAVRDGRIGPWRLFGVPTPVLVEGERGGRALSLSGDDSYTSGVYLEQPLDPTGRAAVAVELRVSVPIIRMQWQSLQVTLGPLPDSAVRARWRHGDEPDAVSDVSDFAGTCSVSLPSDEGGIGAGRARVLAGQRSSPRLALPPAVTDGSWHTLRLELLPDGRCRAGLDGGVLWTSPNAVSRGRPLGLRIEGRAVGTTVRVGGVTSTRG